MQLKFHRLAAAVLSFSLLLGVGFTTAAAEPANERLTILFTHDTHDRFYADAEGRGGYLRLATLIERERSSADAPVVTLDAGDFSMGSLFQTLYATGAPELRALGAMGYDVATLGNHEFDYRAQGLCEMLTAAAESGEKLPALVQANYRVPKDPAAGAALVAAMENYPVTDYTVLERDGLRIAVFGLLGVDADSCAPMSGMEFEPVAEAAQRVVREITEKEDADFVVCLSHTGTEEGAGEDYELAKAVTGIDVILSGHTHSTLEEPMQVGNTLIVSASEYAQNLGRLTVEKAPDGDLQVVDYAVLPVDETLPEDPRLAALAAALQSEVEADFLADCGLGFDEVLATVQEDFSIAETGDLIGDAYIAAVRELEGEDYIPVDFAVAPDGVIRDRLRAGEINTAHAFDILSLGSGADGTPTYPLVSVYLTGADLQNAFEIDASISKLMSAATLYGAGMEWSYNPCRMILDKVTGCAQIAQDGSRLPIEPDRLYRVVADLYSGQMLGAVEAQSFGILTVTPRDKNGEPIADLEAHILHREDGGELKAWYALASYLKAEKTVAPGAPCKEVTPSYSPAALLASPGPSTLLALTLVLLLLLIAVLLVRRSRRRKNTTK